MKLLQLPAAPITSEDDEKRTNFHLAFSSLNKRNLRRATAAAIDREKHNFEPVLACHEVLRKFQQRVLGMPH